MGNTCQSRLRDSNYSTISEDGAPYYRPRTLSSQLTNDTLDAVKL